MRRPGQMWQRALAGVSFSSNYGIAAERVPGLDAVFISKTRLELG